jgi:predicted permease
MSSLLRRLTWWIRGRQKEAELREELEFHIDQEAHDKREAGVPQDVAVFAARRDLGNEARVREDVRAIWTWRPFDELSQDLRFAFRTLFKHRAVAIFAIASLALGIGANTAIYSFMDAILLRALPITDPESLIVVSWRAKPWNNSKGEPFAMHGMDGSTWRYSGGVESRMFPFVSYERLQEASAPVFSTLFGHKASGKVNVLINGAAELADGEYVTGTFFSGLNVSPALGRPILAADDQPVAAPVAVLSYGYSQRRFGNANAAVGAQILINNQPFTVVGVAPPEFFGVDPAAAPSVYMPLRADLLFDKRDAAKYQDPNYYWFEMIGRLRPGVSMAQAQAVLEAAFAGWVTPTATEAERANLPAVHLVEGAGGLDTLRRRFSKPLYVLFGMVGLILAIACANTANLQLARATARRREIAVRRSIGAGRFRLIRQLITESLVLSSISGAIGVLIAIAGTRLLTVLLANGDANFTLHAELNWRVLAVTIVLSMLCGMLFGVAPAIQATRPALVPALKDSGAGPSGDHRRLWPRLRLQQVLVVGQIALLMLLLVAASLFVRTLSNLHSIALGFNQQNLLLFEINAPQAGRPPETVAAFYEDLRPRFAEIPGVRAVTMSHSSLIRAGRGHPVNVDGVAADGTRFMQTGPGFFSTMQIPILQGREIDDRDRAGTMPVVVVSALFAKKFMGEQNPLGRHLTIGGSLAPPQNGKRIPMDFVIIGVAADAHYGPIKIDTPPVVYAAYNQIPASALNIMTFALKTEGDPLRHAGTIREIVHRADSRVPVTNIVTQQMEIDRTINQEVVMARLGTTFAILALVIACVGLYGTMLYAVTRRTREIGIRIALGARRGGVMWMVMREVLILMTLGLVISVPIVRGTSKFVASFLFDMQPTDTQAIAIALATLITASLIAAYGPARRATRIEPTTALREE